MKILLNDTIEFDDDKFKQKLEYLSNNYSSIAMNISSFTDVLKTMAYDEKFIPIINRDILKSGHYGTFNGMKIIVKKTIEPGYAETEGEYNGK